jgi:large subunit ribosomal protein L5
VAEKKNQVAKAAATDKAEKSRLRASYEQDIVPALVKRFGYKNINEVPRLEKVVLNMGLGDCKDNSKSLNLAVDELKLIAGQKPVVTAAKKSVANFKVREGQNVGAKVTLRSKRMYEFLDKLISIVLPRVRDFRGVSAKSFDGRGNYALGVKEQLIFPEISYDKIEKVRGLDICIVTSAKTDEEARELLKLMGLPFAK